MTNSLSTRRYWNWMGAACVALWGTFGGAVHAQNVCEQQASLVNPLQLQAPGIGGTGQVAGRPGVGGTGIDNGGVGGTGIVGVITGFASVCVNGVEVHYNSATPVSDNGSPSSARALAVGQVVQIQARGEGEAFIAQSIAMQFAIVGPIASVDNNGAELHILGQKVWVGASNNWELTRHQWVRVSGQRDSGGRLHASYVQVVPSDGTAQVTGIVGAREGVHVNMYGTDIDLGGVENQASVRSGSELRVIGTWDGHILHAQRIYIEPTQTTLGRPDKLIVEGFVHHVDQQAIRMGEGSWPLAADVTTEGTTLNHIQVNQRVRVTLQRDTSNTLQVARIRVSPPIQGAGQTRPKKDGRSGKKPDDSSDLGPASSDQSTKSHKADDSTGHSGSGGNHSNSGSGSTSDGSGSSGGSGGSGSSNSGSGSSGGSGKGSGGKGKSN